MGLLTKEVWVGIGATNIKWYEDKGYEIPRYIDNRGRIKVKHGTSILVKVEDLQKTSKILVDVQCDECGEILKNINWYAYSKNIEKYNKYYCIKCVYNLFGRNNAIKSHLEKGLSFYNWCYENLSKELADWVLSRWDYELNIDKNGNVIDPKNVNHGSDGVNGKNKRGYWFKCLEHPEHGSELKNICRFTYYFKGFMGSVECIQCNVIALTHPHLVKYFINKEDASKYSFGSNEKIMMRCPDCNSERLLPICDLSVKGFSCKECSDGIPYSEKFTANFLKQLLNKDFTIQLSKKYFKWCKDYKYDNYIEKINCIIETHGLQHYEDRITRWTFLEETEENDFNKEWLARKNNIKNYIILDCRKSDMTWIKNSIMNSRLPILLGFVEKDIDWLKCHEYACNSLVKKVCETWNSGIRNVHKISEEVKLGSQTVIKYLKQVVVLGWCNYAPDCIKIICLTTGEIFDSKKEASNKYNLKISNYIIGCCNCNLESAGKLPDGTKLKWMYYDEYIKQNI